MKLNCSALIRTAIATGLVISLSPNPAAAQAQTESQPPPEAVVRDRTAEATEKEAAASPAANSISPMAVPFFSRAKVDGPAAAAPATARLSVAPDG